MKKYVKDVGNYIMNVTKQGESECMLTTIAALSGVPLDDVRMIALAYSRRKTWLAVVGNHNLYWKTVKYTVKACGLSEQKIPINDLEYAKGNRRRKLPKKTEGSICTIANKAGGRLAHIDPFSNGIVWRTEEETPESFDDYKKRIKAMGVRVKGIWY